MLSIAIIGYGRMGRQIETLAREKGMEIPVIIDNEADWAEKMHLLKACDLAIEFSTPATAFANVKRLLKEGVTVVSGTTGWDKQVPEAIALADEAGAGLMVASNFSIGMNIFLEVNRHLASLMASYDDYQVAVEEVHHVHKLDAPSGTAKSIVSDLLARLPSYTGWTPAGKELSPAVIPVTSIREGEVTGIHKVVYAGSSDRITIGHEAHNRDGFAGGALMAASWMKGREGFHTMQEMLFGA